MLPGSRAPSTGTGNRFDGLLSTRYRATQLLVHAKSVSLAISHSLSWSEEFTRTTIAWLSAIAQPQFGQCDGFASPS